MKAIDDEAGLSFERIVNAPRMLVWQAWTDPKHAKQWWGPAGCTVPVFEADLRPGGRFRIDIEFHDSLTRIEGMYEEVIEPERLVTVGAFVRDGVKLCDTRRIVTFEEADGKTAIAIQQSFFNLSPEAEGMAAGARAGMDQHFDRLEAYLQRRSEV
jgi:uncharacterized protein YndB with AHSA1/START domain